MKQDNYANMVTIIVLRSSSLVAITKSVVNSSAAFERELVVSFLSFWMVHIVQDTVLPDFLSSSSGQKYQRFVLMEKFLFHCLFNLNILEVIYGKETEAKKLCISLLCDGTLFFSWSERRLLLVRAASKYVCILM